MGDQAGGGVAWTLKQSLISFFFLMREHILSVTKSLKEDPAEKPKLLFRRFVFTVTLRGLLS